MSSAARPRSNRFVSAWRRKLWIIAKVCFESRISAGATEKCQKQKLRWNLLLKRYLHGPATWKDTQRNASKDIANLSSKQLSNKTKSQRHAWTTINLKMKKMGSVGKLSKFCSQIVLKWQYSARIGRPDLLWSVNKLARAVTKWTKACDKRWSRLISSTVCSQIVLKCIYFARIRRPDILWSVNKLARSITKWTKARDKRLNRLISYIHHTCQYKQYCHVGNTAKQCRLGLFQDSDFAGDLEDSKSTSGRILCIFRKSVARSYQQVGCARKNFRFTQFYRSWGNFSRCRFTHGLDSRSRSLGLLIEVFHSSPNHTNKTKHVREPRGNLSANPQSHKRKKNSNHEHQSRSDQYWSRFIKRNTFWFQCYVVCLWGQWSRD